MPLFKILGKIAKFFYEEPPEKLEIDSELTIPTGIVYIYPPHDPAKTTLFDYENGRTDVVNNDMLDHFVDNPCDEPEPLNPRYSD